MNESLPRVSIQGFLGSFHHMAAELLLGKDIAIQEREFFKEVFEDVASGRVEYGVVATTNSLFGEIEEVTQLLPRYPSLRIINVVKLPIVQNFIVIPGTTLQTLREVHSQLPALEQCAKFFHAHPSLKTVETTDTALSVMRMMQRGDSTVAAIASARAAQLYQAEILLSSIQDSADNVTSFALLQRQK
jgi:prephenate dehydratase